VPLPASEFALLHSVGGLGSLKRSDLRVIKAIAIYQASTGKTSYTEVISVDGANSPVLGTEQFLSYVTVAQTIGDTGDTYPMTLTQNGMSGAQLDFTVGHEPGEHFILLVNGTGLFAPVAKGGLRLSPQSQTAETVQPHNGKMTVSLIRVIPDTSASNRELQVYGAASETCNSILRATVAAATAAQFSAKTVPAIRVEEQEDLCASFGLAARFATVDHLSYAAYQDQITGVAFSVLVGTPLAIGVDEPAYNTFR
jgi:hypothetical protein